MLLKVKMSRLQARVNILLLVCVNQPVSVRRADCMRALLCVNHKCLHARALLPECMRGYSCFVCLPDNPPTRCDQLRSWQCPTRRVAPRLVTQVLRTKTQTSTYTPQTDRRRQSKTRNRHHGSLSRRHCSFFAFRPASLPTLGRLASTLSFSAARIFSRSAR